MSSNFLPKSIIVILILATSFNVKAQDNCDIFLTQMLFFNESVNNKIYFHYGNINLKNNDVLEGKISLNHLKNGEQSAILKTEDGCRYISNTEIQNVIFFESEHHTGQYTYFVPIKNNKKLFRELYVKDSENAIYDLLDRPFDGKTMSSVYVLENNTLVETYNFWHSGPKADLLNYFEDRDQKKYKRRDYKKLDTLFAQL